MKTLFILIILVTALSGGVAQAQDGNDDTLRLAESEVTFIFYATTGTIADVGDANLSLGTYALITGLGNGPGAISYAGPEFTFGEQGQFYLATMPFLIFGVNDYGLSLQGGWYPESFSFFVLADTDSGGYFSGFTQGFYKLHPNIRLGYIGKWAMKLFKRDNGPELAGSIGPAGFLKMGPVSLNCGLLFGDSPDGASYGPLCNVFISL